MDVRFKLTGEMPLLMHADDVFAADELSAWRKAPENKNLSTPGDDRSPGWTWQTYLYSDGTNVAMPSENIMACLRRAGTSLVMKKQKTFKEVTQSGLLLSSEFCKFTIGDKPIAMDSIKALKGEAFAKQAAAVEGMGFRLFAKRATVGKAKHVRVRPRFDQWEVSGAMHVLVPEITFDVLTTIFDLAGRVGLGDWRPGCKTPGSYGMFKAELKKL